MMYEDDFLVTGFVTNSYCFPVTNGPEFKQVIEDNWPAKVQIINQEHRCLAKMHMVEGSWPLETVVYRDEEEIRNICPTIAKYLVPGEYATLFGGRTEEVFAEVIVIASDGSVEYGNVYSLAESLQQQLKAKQNKVTS